MGPDLVSQLVNDERAIGSKVRYDYNSRAASPSSRLVGKTCVFVRATSFGRSPKRRASRELVRRPRGDESFVARFDARVSRLSALPLSLTLFTPSSCPRKRSSNRTTATPTHPQTVATRAAAAARYASRRRAAQVASQSDGMFRFKLIHVRVLEVRSLLSSTPPSPWTIPSVRRKTQTRPAVPWATA